MKDIIAALDASAGGGEKRRAAQLASIAFTALLSLAACSQPAAAREAHALPPTLHGDWTDPSGRFSLTYANRGWRPIAPKRNAGDVLEIAGPNDREGHIDMCALLAPSSGGLMGGSQDSINAKMRSRTVAADVPPAWSSAEGFQFAHAMVDGVAVIDISFSRDSTYERWRSFRLPAPIGATQYSLGCAATLPVTNEEHTELEAIITSLRFAPER